MLRKFNQVKRLTRVLPRAQFSWIPDGKERNDYQHKEFVPFDYQKHGKYWDPKKWPLAFESQEQSPIALYRNPANHPNFHSITYCDRDYEHKYEDNIDHVKEDNWTGTSYQVPLNYRNDFMTTKAINLFYEQSNLDHNFTTRGI